jgi:hypothetical protein
MAFFVLATHQPYAKAQSTELTIELQGMNGWPGGASFGIWEGGWEANLYFDVPVMPNDIVSTSLRLHMYAKTTGYSKAILDNLQLNGYVLEKEWTFAYDWWGSGIEKDESVTWNIPKEYIKTGQNHLYIGLYFTDLDDLYTEDFLVYGLSKVTLQILDTTPPATTISLSGVKSENDIYTSPVAVSFSANDSLSGVSSIFYKIDSGNWRQYEFPFDISDEGRHVLQYYSQDVKGNQEQQKYVSFVVDLSPPEIDVKEPMDGSCFAQSSVTLSWNGTDKSGIDHYEILLDDYCVGNTTSATWNFDGLGEGTHTLTVIGYDHAGHYARRSVVVTNDYTCPDIIITSNNMREVYGTVTVVASAMDDLSGVDRVELNVEDALKGNMNQSGPTWIYRLDTSLLSGGYHIIRIKAIDKAGNSKTLETAIEVRKLSLRVEFSNGSPIEGEVVKIDVYVMDQQGSVINGSEVKLMLDGRTIDSTEVQPGHYQSIVNTTGIINPLDLLYRSINVTITAYHNAYNSDSIWYRLTVQRNLVPLNLIFATFAGMLVFYLPIHFSVKLFEKKRPLAYVLALLYILLGIMTGYFAYGLSQLIPVLIVLPGILLVAGFSLCGMVATLYLMLRQVTQILRKKNHTPNKSKSL